MPKFFRRRKEDIKIDDAIKRGPYIPPPSRPNAVQTVDVPPEFESLFSKAEETVAGYFDEMEWSPVKGTISISGSRYILLNAESFQAIPQDLSDDLDIPIEKANKLYYELAKSIGKRDARRFIYKMGVTDPIAKLSSGPVHFAFTGNARVSFLPSNPVPDETYLLRYDHPQSFEADEYLRKNGPRSKIPVCIWNSGYSAGWCTESFGIELDAREISCRAMGHKNCRFVMSSPETLEDNVKQTLEEGF
ncbi:MAG TPA: V4R domain-containing protein [Candidatus Lokiarchaeia archaeon]|nr:V4R domain-containing protein [Candidatus Lokiarchaeia archaeon]